MLCKEWTLAHAWINPSFRFVQETQTISLDYGDELRAHRRIYHDYLRPPSLQTHHPLIKAGVDVLLQSLANSPDKFLDHFKL